MLNSPSHHIVRTSAGAHPADHSWLVVTCSLEQPTQVGFPWSTIVEQRYILVNISPPPQLPFPLVSLALGLSLPEFAVRLYSVSNNIWNLHLARSCTRRIHHCFSSKRNPQTQLINLISEMQHRLHLSPRRPHVHTTLQPVPMCLDRRSDVPFHPALTVSNPTVPIRM